MSQLSLELFQPAIAAPPQHTSPERRIDITLATLADIHEAMSDAEKDQLTGKKWWATIVLVARLRAMERGEEEALGRPSRGLADAYDRVVSPGEHAGEAILRTFAAMYSKAPLPGRT